MTNWTERLRYFFYDSRRPLWVDGTTAFANDLRRRIRASDRVLNIGAGEQLIYSLPGRIVGIDPDPYIGSNRSLFAAVRGYGEILPFRSASFDVAFMDWVVEHLSDPLACVREIFRILKPGGVFAFRTGNLFHYSYAISRLTPHRFHEWISGEDAHPFPTFYRMNTPRAVSETMHAAGFVEDSLTLFESDPAYVSMTVPSYLAGVAYERLVNRFAALGQFRACIHACFRKPSSI